MQLLQDNRYAPSFKPGLIFSSDLSQGKLGE
jgi:hypothetical protein